MSLRSRIRESAEMARLRLTSPLERAFPSYDAAAAVATYDNAALTEVVAAKTERYRQAISHDGEPPNLTPRDMSLGLVLLRTARQRDKLTVIDIGGACGTHYFLAKRLFGPAVWLNWRVVETQAMAEAGRQRFQSPELSFFNDLRTAVSIGGEI